MYSSNSNLVVLAAILFAAGSLAGVRAADPNPREVPEARQITEPRHETFDEFVVHYSAQMTTRVPEEVARSLDITRRGNRAMLNVTVLLQGDAEDIEPLEAEVEVEATNLAGQFQNIPVRELQDGESVYYIGEFTIANEEILTFTVRVRPEGADLAHEFSFQQQFFTD